MKLPDIKIEINNIVYENTFNDDIRIDRTNLDVELSTQAEKYAYYGFIAAEAEFIYSVKKQELERLYSQLDGEKRNTVLSAKARGTEIKYTEKMYENEVITDSRYTEQAKEVLKARLLADQLKVCAQSFAQRREMLISISAGHRGSLLPHRVLETEAEVVRDIISTSQNSTISIENTIPQLPNTQEQTRRRKPIKE